MKTRENIDRLYRDRLKNVETTPREDVWKNIAARLPHEKKKKRIIPLWYKFAGIAALLILFFSVGSIFLKPIENEDSFTSNSVSSSLKVKKEIPRNSNFVSNNFKEKMHLSNNLLQSLAGDTRMKISNQKLDANSENYSNNPVNKSNKKLFSDILLVSSNNKLNNPGYTFEDYNSEKFYSEEQQKLLSQEITYGKKLNDLALLANEEKESENETIESLPSKRLSVSTSVAAVYFDNLGTGSSIARQFDNNKSSGEVSVAYGVNIAYQISEKIKIRSGINKIDLGLNTQDVELTSAVRAISRGSEQLNFNTSNSFTSLGLSSNEATTFSSSRISGELSQNMGFIEVPFEVEYAIINNKIGLNIIGGASAFFLNDNKVVLHSPDADNSLGEAQNLNSLSYSTNIGLGIDYNISPRIQWNFEPIFKYQLNTFNNSPGVKPYNLGIYSGFSFKF